MDEETVEEELPAPRPAPSGEPVIGNLTASSLATVMHVAGLVFGPIPALIVWAMRSDEPFLRHHASESLNLHISVIAGFAVAAVLVFVVIGFFLFFALIFGTLAVQVVAAMAAKRGEYYDIPFTLSVVK